MTKLAIALAMAKMHSSLFHFSAMLVIRPLTEVQEYHGPRTPWFQNPSQIVVSELAVSKNHCKIPWFPNYWLLPKPSQNTMVLTFAVSKTIANAMAQIRWFQTIANTMVPKFAGSNSIANTRVTHFGILRGAPMPGIPKHRKFFVALSLPLTPHLLLAYYTHTTITALTTNYTCQLISSHCFWDNWCPISYHKTNKFWACFARLKSTVKRSLGLHWRLWGLGF